MSVNIMNFSKLNENDNNENKNKNQENSQSLENIENYKKNINNGYVEIITKYMVIINEYFTLCSDSIHMSNEEYYKYVIMKGIETITHVFKILLLYTKNLNITYYYSQKSLYYYVEFISQIGETNHSFLKLNSCDASLFVFKKSIYEINQEYRKTFIMYDEDTKIMKNVDKCITLYNNIIQNMINKIEHKGKESNNLLMNVEIKTKNIFKQILNVIEKDEELLNNELLNDYIKKVLLLTEDNENITDYINLFMEKIKKGEKNDIINKLNEGDIKNKYDTSTKNEFINWFME